MLGQLGKVLCVLDHLEIFVHLVDFVFLGGGGGGRGGSGGEGGLFGLSDRRRIAQVLSQRSDESAKRWVAEQQLAHKATVEGCDIVWPFRR